MAESGGEGITSSQVPTITVTEGGTAHTPSILVSAPVAGEESSSEPPSPPRPRLSSQSYRDAVGRRSLLKHRTKVVEIKKQEQKPTTTSIIKLFRFATAFDLFLILLGTLTAIAHGVAFPLAMFYFGDITNAFVDHESSMRLVADTAGLCPTEGGGFIPIDYANVTGGVVDCSTTYMFTSPISGANCTFTLEEILRTFVNSNTKCLTDSSFITEINLYIYIFLAIAVGAFIAGSIQVWLFQTAADRQLTKIRLTFYRAILRQEIGWFDANPSGELTNRLSEDMDQIHAGIGDNLAILIQWVTTFFAAFAIGFIRDWRLALVLLGVTPFLAIAGAVFSRVGAVFTSKEQKEYATAGAVAEEVISSIRTVVAFGGEYKEADRYDSYLAAAKRFGTTKGFATGFSIGLTYFLIFACYSLAFWFGGYLVSIGDAEAGDVLTVFFAVITGAFFIGQAGPNFQKLVSSAGAADSVYKTIDRQPTINSASHEGLIPDKFDSTLEFSNVRFSYPTRPDVEVLQDVSFKVNVGQTVALVGPSGCGKSTVIQLLQRFYDIDSGEVLVGGDNVKNLNLKWLRSKIGVVSQEPVLFNTTIAGNIRHGKEDATTEEIEQAARDANAYDFIMQLPNGFNTHVGERGTQLSGGQKQRIAIARALVRNPQVLLLDEATSALDLQSESIVQNALDQASACRTTIIVAHRLSTIQNADIIIALEEGTVAEMGTHKQLMASQGLYYDLVTAQTNEVAFVTPEPSRFRSRSTVVGDLRNRLRSRRSSSQRSLRSRSVRLVRQLTRSSPQLTRRLGRRSRSKKVSVLEVETGDESYTQERPAATSYREFTEIQSKDSEWVLVGNEPEDEELPKVSILRIWKVNQKLWYLLLLGILGAMLNGAVFPVFAIVFGEILEVFARPSDEVLAGVHLWAGMFLVLGTASALGILLKNVCFSISGENLTSQLRSLTFRAILRQEIGWFDDEKNSTGILSTRLSSDAGRVQGAAGIRLGTLLETVTGLLLALVIAFIYSWILAFVVLGIMPVVAISSAIYFRLVTGTAKSSQEALQSAIELAVDSIENIDTVVSLGIEDKFYELFKAETLKPYRKALPVSILFGLTYGFSQATIFFGYIVAFRFGAFQVTLDPDNILHTEFQNVYRVFAALVFGALAIGAAGSFAPDYTKAKLAAERVFALIDTEPSIDSYATYGDKLDTVTGEIALTDVDFYYPARPDVKVLQGLSVSVKPGQTLALVGPSGCGKSTVVSLIERFYDPASGSLTLDGTFFSDLNVRWLRSQIGIVSQEPVLFDASIADNIRYGANFREVSDEEIIEAAKAANIHNFIESLPMGYNTNVGSKGTLMSGGQKQRIAIARALVRDPKVLLLDEATSALDTESEKIVQEALDKAREGRTSIVIAHRLSTIYGADCIAVIKRGKVIELGSHHKLMEKRGFYYKLNSFQMQRGMETHGRGSMWGRRSTLRANSFNRLL